MTGFKMPTEEKVVTGKRTKYVLYCQKNTNFTLATWHLICRNTGAILFPRTTRHIALFLCPYTLSRGHNGANDSQTDTETWWPWARIRWGHMVCEKNYLNDGIQCCHFYCVIPHDSYITDVQHPKILVWKPCILARDWLWGLHIRTQKYKIHLNSI